MRCGVMARLDPSHGAKVARGGYFLERGAIVSVVPELRLFATLIDWYEGVLTGEVYAAPSSFERLWNECDDARALLGIVGWCASSDELSRALCSVARSVGSLADQPDEALALLDRAEREAPSEALAMSAFALERGAKGERAAASYATSAVTHVVFCLCATSAAERGRYANEVAACAAMAVASDAEARGTTEDSFVQRDEHLGTCARIVRERVGAPSVESLERALGELRAR